MNFRELAQMQARTKDLQHQRSHQAGQGLEQGLALLQQAEAGQFRNKQQLEQALNCFLEAIQLQRSDPEPYFAAAYLFLLVRDFHNALKYLQAVRGIQPQHPDLPSWFAYLENPAAFGRSQPAASAGRQGLAPVARLDQGSRPASAVDPDQLQDTLRAEIGSVIRQWQALPAPGPDPAMLLALQQEQSHLKQQVGDFRLRIEALEQELDTFSLRRVLQPLEKRLAQLQELVEAVFKMVQLKQELERLLNYVQEQRHLPASPHTPALLEKVLDQCDYYADQLDHLDAGGIRIAELEAPYQRVVEAVEKWQDLLDES